ncbi:VanW family protein [Paractinoplanes lichenicola]|uniref:VanW family protein n=1 Tax=Paractinoplanes lichenicola TaxID=2802976 RepID=A0ABS1VPT5_9ACTN|nr:VanW family protein [Actinoplanes lichenicola]MBL7255762.1 VanW family protein [Actinoplanes lichenicola]
MTDERWTASAAVPPPAAPGRGKRRWVLGVGVGVLVLLVGIGALLVRPSTVVPAKTFIAGVAVGGLNDQQLRDALDGPVRAKVEQPVEIEAGDQRFTARPGELGVRLDADATRRAVGVTRLRLPGGGRHDITPVLSVDEAAATKGLDTLLAPVGKPARRASVVLAKPGTVLDGKGDLAYEASARGVTVQAGEPGRGVDTTDAVRLLTGAVREGATAVAVAVRALPPGDADPKLAGVDQLIGTFTTYHPCCAPRVSNIHRIAELVDGTVVPAGATFSLNDTAGERTRANGFVPAPAIVDGELEDQLGGGVSQFSTTLFNAAWFAGLDVVKHQPHSLYISRYPPGREATLDWRSIDNVIRNDTDAPFVIRVRSTDTSVTVGLYGHTGDREVRSVTGPRRPRDNGGFRVTVTRTVLQGGQETGTKSFSWTYQGLD